MVWSGQYGQEPGRASLNYISLGVGFIIGLQVSGPMIDYVRSPLTIVRRNKCLTPTRSTSTSKNGTATPAAPNSASP